MFNGIEIETLIEILIFQMRRLQLQPRLQPHLPQAQLGSQPVTFYKFLTCSYGYFGIGMRNDVSIRSNV